MIYNYNDNDIYHYNDKILKDSTHPGNHLFCLLPSGRRFRSMMAKTERLRRSFFPQAIRLLNTNQSHKLTRLLLKNIHILITRIAALCTYPAQSVCTSLLFILLFIKSQYTVFCTSYCLHFLFHSTFYSYFSFLTYICSCVVLLLYHFYFYSFALSTERT